VLIGTALPDVAAEKSAAQEPMLPAPVHEASTLASEFSFAVGTASVEGRPAPGDAPVEKFASLLAVKNALSRPVVFVQLAPTFPPFDINDASAHTDAVVVTSFTTNVSPELRLPQGPIADISQIAVLGSEAEAGWPRFESK
jgi:hypothetical protein